MTDDYGFFVRQSWSIVEPKTPLVWSWHYDYICEWLMYVSSGAFKREMPDKDGLIINVPPRTGKSTFITIDWPVWTWLRYPERRFLCASYSGKLSIDHGAKRRYLLHSDWFRTRFSDRFGLIVDQAVEVRNTHTGYYISTSVDGSGTGFGGDICIGDDLLSAKDALSKTVRDSTNRWIDDTFSTRLNNRVTGTFVHVSQRLADDDPTGFLQERYADRWVQIKVPREEPERKIYLFPVSKQTYQREALDVLQPERCPPLVLEGLRAKKREWANQEQQEPAPEGGAIFDPNWWQYFVHTEPYPSFDMVALSIDCAFKAYEESDYVAIHKWASVGARSYLLEKKTMHLGYVATKAEIKAMVSHELSCPWCKGLRPDVVLIEDKANGSAVIEELRRSPMGHHPDGTPFFVPIIAIEPQGGKDARASAASAEAEAGNVFLNQDMPGFASYLQTMSHYVGEGSVPHDDDVDATSQYLIWRHKRRMGLSQFYEKIEARSKRGGKLLPMRRESEMVASGPNGHRVVWDPNKKIWLDFDTREEFRA